MRGWMLLGTSMLLLSGVSFRAATAPETGATATPPAWPYSPPRAGALLRVRETSWCRNPIDRFVLAKLEARGLRPAPPAGKNVLLRRVFLDLVGVPPSPAEADLFLSDRSPDAYEKLVD